MRNSSRGSLAIGIRSNSSDSTARMRTSAVEALLHDVVMQNIIQGQQAHSLVVRHVGVNHHAALAIRACSPG